MFASLKNAYRLQELMIRLVARRHPQVEHSLEKIRGLKKAFHFVNYEGVPGDYVEFGMFEGASFIAALEAHLATRAVSDIERAFWGFDSFEGLRFDQEAASHHRLAEGHFQTSYERVERRIKRNFGYRAEWHIVRGFLQETIADKTPSELGIERVAVAMFDLDLEEPTRLGLRFIRPALQEGSVLLFDALLLQGPTRSG